MFSATLILLLYFMNGTFAYNSTYALSPELQQQVLDEHNRLRALHVDTPPLVWNDVVAGFAQDWAAQYDCSGILTHSEKPYGENLAIGYTAIDAIDTWYNEIRFYNYSNPGYSEIVGHFTQMVWKDSSRLGCAIRNCHNEWTTYFVCEYDPPGNYIGYFGQEVMPLKVSVAVPSSSSSLITSSSTSSSSTTSSLTRISNLINSSSQTTLDTVTRSSLSSVASTESLVLGLVDSEEATSHISPNSVSVSSSYSSIGKPQPTSTSLQISSTVVSQTSTYSSSISGTSTTSSISLSSAISFASSTTSSTTSLLSTSTHSISSSVASSTSQTGFSTQVNITISVNSNSADRIPPVSTATDMSNLDALSRVESSTSASISSDPSDTSISESSAISETSTGSNVSSSVATESVSFLPQPRAVIVSSSSRAVSSIITAFQVQNYTSSSDLSNTSKLFSEFSVTPTGSWVESISLPNATSCSTSTLLSPSVAATTTITTAGQDTSVDSEFMTHIINGNTSFVSSSSSYVGKSFSVDPEDMIATANITFDIVSTSSPYVIKVSSLDQQAIASIINVTSTVCSTSSSYVVKDSSVVTVISSALNVTAVPLLVITQTREVPILRNIISSFSENEVPRMILSSSYNNVSSQATTLKSVVKSTVTTQSNFTGKTSTTVPLSIASTINNQDGIHAIARSLNSTATITRSTTDSSKLQTVIAATTSSHLISIITTCDLNGFVVDCTSFTVSVSTQEISPTTTPLSSETSQPSNARFGQQSEPPLIYTTANRSTTFITVSEGVTLFFTSTITEVTSISGNVDYLSSSNQDDNLITSTTDATVETGSLPQIAHNSITETVTEVNPNTNTKSVPTLQSTQGSSIISILEATTNAGQNVDAIYESGSYSTTSETIVQQTQAQESKPVNSESVSAGIINVSENSPHSTNIISHYEGGANNILKLSSLLYSVAFFILMF